MVERRILVPDYIYSARTKDEFLPIFENEFYKNNDEYDRDLLFDEELHQMALRIGYVFFDNLRATIKQRDDVEIAELGDESFTWRYVKALLPDKPNIYCFGAGTNVSFEVEIAKDTNNEVFCFDPTPQAAEHVNNLLSDNPLLKFYPMGLLGTDGIAKFFKPHQKNLGSLSVLNLNAGTRFMDANVRRLQTIMRTLGHDHLDLLKMDIEGAEHSSIEDLVFSGVSVSQIAVEFDQPVPPWRIIRTMSKLLVNGYELVDCWGLNCLFVKSALLDKADGN